MTLDKAELIAEAERIAERLLRTAVVDQESLYSGNAGVALFYRKLALATGKAAYLDAAEAALRAVLAAEIPTHHGFYTGRLGVAWVLLQFGEHDRAVEIAKGAIEARTSHTADLLGGVAGTLLGVLHVHAATGEPSLVSIAEQLIEELVERARPARVGLYWDRAPEQIRGLCGLSHGASGIGWVLAEAARYGGDETLADLARQAFAYERDHFNEATGNWTDFRRSTLRPSDLELLEESYMRGDLAPFYRTGDMNAWCHGAAGIGLARLRAVELLGDEELREDLRRAVRRVAADFERSVAPTATLCHGTFGNAALLFAAGSGHDALVHRVVAASIARAREHGGYASGHAEDRTEDASLLMGSSGVGWFLLQLAAGERRDPLLLPQLPSHGAAALRPPSAPRREEGTRWRLAENANLALLTVRGIVHRRRADELLARRLRLSDDLAIEAETLLLATLDGAAEVELAPLAAAILAEFDEPRTVDEVVARMIESIDADPAELAPLVRAQIRDALVSTILVPA